LRLAHHEDEDADQDQRREQEGERAQPAAPAAGRLGLDRDLADVDLVGLDRFEDVGVGWYSTLTLWLPSVSWSVSTWPSLMSVATSSNGTLRVSPLPLTKVNHNAITATIRMM
jgi:hypothetical protein